MNLLVRERYLRLSKRSVAKMHRCDFFVPVSSPVSAVSDSRARPLLEELGCRVLHFGLEECLRLDDKHAFGLWARELGLPYLDSFHVPSEDAARELNRQLQGCFRPNTDVHGKRHAV